MSKENKSIVSNSLFYFIYNTLNILFPLVTGIYVARVLLPINIGQFESAKNLAQYFIILSFLGIPTYGLREISKARHNKENLDKIYSELFIINGISTSVFSVAYFALILFVPYYHSNLLLFSITGFSIILNFLNNSWLYEGLEEFKYISIRNIIFKAISFVLLVIFVRKQSDYYWYAIITIIGTAGNYFFNVLRARKLVHFSFKNINLKRHLKPIFFLAAVNFAIEIYLLVDVTMLGFMCGEEIVAYYSYGMKIYRILLQVVNIFTIVTVPRLALYYKENDENGFNSLTSKTLKAILLLAIPVIVGIWFTSDCLLTFVYGNDYIRSSIVLKILSLILVISPIGYLLGSRMLLITGNENKMIIPVACGALTNVLANIVLIYYFNEIGAAIASLIGEIVVMTIYIFLGRKKYKIVDFWSGFWKIIVSTTVMAMLLIGISFIPLNKLYITLIQIVAAVLTYFTVLVLLKESTVLLVIDRFFKLSRRKKQKTIS